MANMPRSKISWVISTQAVKCNISVFQNKKFGGGFKCFYAIQVVAPDLFSGQAPEVTIRVDGSLVVFGQTLEGAFVFERIGTGIEATTSVSVTISKLELTAGGTSILEVSGSGLLLLNTDGLAGTASLTLVHGPAAPVGVSFGNGTTFSLALNNTTQTVAAIAGVAVNLPAGPYGSGAFIFTSSGIAGQAAATLTTTVPGLT